MDVRTFSDQLLARYCREERQLKDLGLHAQAAGIRVAITILIKEIRSPAEPPPLEPSP